tara:strand:+ start:5291 stop:8050 length:2760 start_codon:yes stop_codon:yes gene_type:complete
MKYDITIKKNRKKKHIYSKILSNQNIIIAFCIFLTILNIYYNKTVIYKPKPVKPVIEIKPVIVIQEQNTEHYILIPLLYEHYDKLKNGLLTQFINNELEISNQKITLFIYITGVPKTTGKKCQSINNIIIDNIKIEVFCKQQKEYKGVAINNLINTIKGQNHRKETLVTVMDADDLYLSCTLYMVVEAFKRLKTNLILHSFTNKNDIRKANYLSGTKQDKCNEPNVELDAKQLLNLVKTKKTPWIIENAHHGHHTTTLETIITVKYGTAYRSQDSKFVRDVIQKYPESSQYLNNVFTVYDKPSELWKTIKLSKKKQIKKIEVTHTWMGYLGNEIWQYLALNGIAKTLNRNICIHNNKKLKNVYHYKPRFLDSVFENIKTFKTCKHKIDKIQQEQKHKYTNFQQDRKSENIFIAGYLQHNKYFSINDLKINKILLKHAENILQECDKWIGIHVRQYPKSHDDIAFDFKNVQNVLLDIGYHACIYITGNNYKKTKQIKEQILTQNPVITKIIVSNNSYNIDFAVLTLVDTLIINTGTFAYFAAKFNTNPRLKVYYNKNAKLLLGYKPIQKPPNNWFSYETKNLQKLDCENCYLDAIYRKLSIQFNDQDCFLSVPWHHVVEIKAREGNLNGIRKIHQLFLTDNKCKKQRFLILNKVFIGELNKFGNKLQLKPSFLEIFKTNNIVIASTRMESIAMLYTNQTSDLQSIYSKSITVPLYHDLSNSKYKINCTSKTKQYSISYSGTNHYRRKYYIPLIQSFKLKNITLFSKKQTKIKFIEQLCKSTFRLIIGGSFPPSYMLYETFQTGVIAIFIFDPTPFVRTKKNTKFSTTIVPLKQVLRLNQNIESDILYTKMPYADILDYKEFSFIISSTDNIKLMLQKIQKIDKIKLQEMQTKAKEVAKYFTPEYTYKYIRNKTNGLEIND